MVKARASGIAILLLSLASCRNSQTEEEQYIARIRQSHMAESAQESLTHIAGAIAGTHRMSVSPAYQIQYYRAYCAASNQHDPLVQRRDAILAKLRQSADYDSDGFISRSEAIVLREDFEFGQCALMALAREGSLEKAAAALQVDTKIFRFHAGMYNGRFETLRDVSPDVLQRIPEF